MMDNGFDLLDFEIPTSNFCIPHSAFRIPHSAFRIPHSEIRDPNSMRRHSTNYYPVLLGLIGAAALFILLLFFTTWPIWLIWIIALSVTTFFLFAVDKALANAGRGRIPEIVLHTFTLLGGFPGQLLGRLVFRHKINFSRHPAFNIVLVVSLLLWAALALLLPL